MNASSRLPTMYCNDLRKIEKNLIWATRLSVTMSDNRAPFEEMIETVC